MQFQSTPPVKAATSLCRRSSAGNIISIHAAREGGDESAPEDWQTKLEISIHAAREGGDFTIDNPILFKSTDFNPRRP